MFRQVRMGDVVTRMLAFKIPLKLNVTSVDDFFIHCGPWKFLRTNGGEVDEELGWDGIKKSGSILRRTFTRNGTEINT